MFHAKYLTSADDIGDALFVRSMVEELGQSGRDEHDRYAVYAVVYDDGGAPVGGGRLFPDPDGNVHIDAIGVIKSHRRQFYGDLITGMLLTRARELSAPAMIAAVPEALCSYFARYGFEEVGPGPVVCGQNGRMMRIIDDRIRFESRCAHDDVPMCTGDCAHCQRKH